MYTLAIRSDPNTDSQIAYVWVWVLSFTQQEGKRRGWQTWWVLVGRDGNGSDPDVTFYHILIWNHHFEYQERERERAREVNWRRKEKAGMNWDIQSTAQATAGEGDHHCGAAAVSMRGPSIHQE